MNAQSDLTQKRILRWVLAGAVVLLFISIITTVAVLWWMRRDAASQSSANGAPAASAPTPMANWSPATFNATADNGIRETSDKSWSVKGGRAFMNVRRKDDDSFEVRFVYPFDFLPRDTVALVQTRWDVREVEKQADALNITADQIAALKAVSPATDMPVSAPDKERLRSLFEDYISAKDPAAEKALLEAVADLDAKYYDPTIARIEGIAEKVKSIFNQEQLTALFERRGLRNP
jgi:hypothetical protein